MDDNENNMNIIRGGLTPLQLGKATALIEENLDGALSIAEIAKECGLSASYFARAFKVSTGFTPYRWLVKRKVETAMELMATTSLSLRDVAKLCGFVDHAHFTRTFRAEKNTTPSAWRRNVGQSPSADDCLPSKDVQETSRVKFSAA